jgi:hypothetical protein
VKISEKQCIVNHERSCAIFVCAKMHDILLHVQYYCMYAGQNSFACAIFHDTIRSYILAHSYLIYMFQIYNML